ncbi:hypothetical protein DVH05_028297 [Phytophthora capsici]|nr:hypothetical protein DVH05_028297 [Phytophthora capsici]
MSTMLMETLVGVGTRLIRGKTAWIGVQWHLIRRKATLPHYEGPTRVVTFCTHPGRDFGDVILFAQDREQSFKYATQLASGSERGSVRAWYRLLSAFCVMEGRVWNDDNYEEEKNIFLEKLPKTDKTTKAQLGAKAKWNKKRSMADMMPALREKKKAKSGSITKK